MQAWTTECLFSDSGALLPPVGASERLALSGASSASTPLHHSASVASLQPRQHTAETPTPTPPTPTPTPAAALAPQELQAPSLGAFLAVPPAFAMQSARSRSEAALLYEIAATALEVDVLLESVREQLHDRRRVGEWLRAATSTNTAETTLLVLQQQARGVTERNLRLLLERCQACLQKLSDLQFPLIQSIESCDVSVSELEALGSAEVAAQRRKLADVQAALLERLQTLLKQETIPFASRLVTSVQLRQQQPGRNSVCWPAGSNNSEESKRSTQDDVCLSSSSGSMHSPFSTLSALDERRLMDAEDPTATLTDHHQLSLREDTEDDYERSTRGEGVAVQAGEAASNPLDPPERRQSIDESNGSNTEAAASNVVDRSGRRESNASDHALSESVY